MKLDISKHIKIRAPKILISSRRWPSSTLLLKLVSTESVASNILKIHVPSIIFLGMYIAAGCSTKLLNSLLGLSLS